MTAPTRDDLRRYVGACVLSTGGFSDAPDATESTWRDSRLMASALEPLTVYEELTPPLSPDEALVAADQCLECGGPHAPAPCVVACPADVDVPSFVALIAEGNE